MDFFVPFFERDYVLASTSREGFEINIPTTSEVSGMETGSRCSPEPDGPHRSLATKWKFDFHSAAIKIRM